MIAITRAALCAASCLLFTGIQAQERPLDAPEAAYWHEASSSWFVTNLGNGMDLSMDGSGFIARYDASGELTDARWLEGLHAPTGLVSVGTTLFVVDRDGLARIDLASATLAGKIPLPDAVFPNDVTATSDGALYVSDMAANRIYRVAPGAAEAEIWLESADLQHPNGLHPQADALVVAAWGLGLDLNTFATERPGTLLRVDLASREISAIGSGEPIGHLDGVVQVGEDYFVTDWMAGRLLRVSPDGEAEIVLSGLPQMADLGFSESGRVLAMPLMGDNRVLFLRLESLRR